MKIFCIYIVGEPIYYTMCVSGDMDSVCNVYSRPKMYPI